MDAKPYETAFPNYSYAEGEGACFKPGLNQVVFGARLNRVLDGLVSNVVKEAGNVCIENPSVGIRSQPSKALGDSIVSTSARSKTIAIRFELGFPFGFQCIFDDCLSDSIPNGGNTEGTGLAVGLRDVYSPRW